MLLAYRAVSWKFQDWKAVRSHKPGVQMPFSGEFFGNPSSLAFMGWVFCLAPFIFLASVSQMISATSLLCYMGLYHA